MATRLNYVALKIVQNTLQGRPLCQNLPNLTAVVYFLDNTPSKGNGNEALKKNYFHETHLHLGNTSEEFSKDDPLLASQSPLSNPHNGNTRPYTPKSLENDVQSPLRRIETYPSTTWPTITASTKKPTMTQQNKKTNIQLQETENSDSQMDIDSNLYKTKQAETDANNCLRIERITVEEIPALENVITKQQALINSYQEINPQHTICTQLMIDVRENELKVGALKDDLFRIGPSKPKPHNDAHIPIQISNSFQNRTPDVPEIPAIILKIAENYNIILQEITHKFLGTNNTLFRGNTKISANSTEDRNNIIKLLQDKNQEFILYEPIAESRVKDILKGVHASTPRSTRSKNLKNLTSKSQESIIQSQFKNFKERTRYPVFQVDIKRSPQAEKIFNLTHLCHFKITAESPRRRNTVQDFHHTAKNVRHNTRCIKCRKNHATRDCNIKEKLRNPTCINCNNTGHTDAWKGCPAFPKFNTRQVNFSYANITKRNPTQHARNNPQPTETAENLFNLPSLSEAKELLHTLQEIKKIR
ncbi:hypothetical protein AVEN_9992-1 [Araneus ventricosus]|uniref:Pre-C2HC domain-containing protein n=1 Tax=Araneus ventricosus TaxID=182803 RepID=A0A4Y2PZG5_ARAVE|nr:hypothetical protein AVEN_9992-1 [Araneus ventricosus]